MRNANLIVFAAATRDGTNRHKARSGRMEAFGGKHTLRTYGGEAQVVSSAGRPLSKFIGTTPK